jgi:cell wall-associated NlpC family hydrolase
MAHLRTSLGNLHVAPSRTSRIGSQILFGDMLDILDSEDGWARVRMARDGYEGFLEMTSLSTDTVAVTHHVSVPLTYLYPNPNIKDQPATLLYLNSAVMVADHDGEFSRLATGGYIYSRHLRAGDRHASDAVSIAEQFLHAPYLWGGISFSGVDCSGLVQMARLACGISSPRDTHQQENAGHLHMPIDCDMRRGLLVFWPGHVAITVDAGRIIHASGHQMQVVIEPLSDAVARNAAKGISVTSIQAIQ